MTKSHLLAATAASLLVLGMTVSQAQGQAGRPTAGNYRPPAATAQPHASTPFALLDVTRVFKEYKHFLALKNDLEVDVKNAEGWVKERQTEIQSSTEALKGLKQGGMDYKKREQEIAGKIGFLAAQVKLQQKQFLEKEAAIHDTIYKEVEYAVSQFARANGYIAVFRFSGAEPVAPNTSPSPQNILMKINGPVIWHAPNADITTPVLQMLNKRFVDRRVGNPHKTGVVPR